MGFVVTPITGKEAQGCDILAKDGFANRRHVDAVSPITESKFGDDYLVPSVGSTRRAPVVHS